MKRCFEFEMLAEEEEWEGMAIQQVVHSNNSHERNDFGMIFGGF